ncbi:MAG TPA: multidrug effflux MFS transporter [Aldersonia sp.]
MTDNAPTATGPRRVVLVLGALIALGPLTIDAYLPALPAIADDLDATDALVQLTLTGTLAGLAVGQLVVGPLSDALGRRRPMIAGIGVHVIASLLCVVAPSVAILGVLRAVQGFGAAAAMVIAMAVVRDLYVGSAAATVLSRLILVMGVAPILAPSLGGLILLRGSWRGIFVMLAVFGVALIFVAVFALRETLPRYRRRPVGVGFALRGYLRLVRDPIFVALAVAGGLAMSTLFAYIAGASFVLQDDFGLDEQQFALVFGVGAVALIAASQVNVVVLRRYALTAVVGVALAAALGAAVLLGVFAMTGAGGVWGFVVPVWLVLAASGFVLPNAPALALSRHGEAAGTAAALVGAAQFGIGALVAPLVGVLGNDSIAMATVMVAGPAVALVALGGAGLASRRQVPTPVAVG